MTTVELLEAAKAKIDTPEKWCKGQYAFDKGGTDCASDDPAAVSWCMEGAVHSVTKDADSRWEAEKILAKACGSGGHLWMNDDESTTHADVMAAFDKAIALAKQEAAP